MSLLREAERCLANQKTYAGLNAFISPLTHSDAWRSRVSDADARKGALKSPLDGRLVAVKDNICTCDMPTTCGSRILESFTSPYNASVIDYLQQAGALLAGKTNMDEFGMGSHSVHSHFGPVRNAVGSGEDILSAGGSSGGSAVAAATGQCYAALGTDTGGSVRLPAAYTGTVGFKPSYGFVSRWGVVAYANSLDTVGVIGPQMLSVRKVFDVISRYDHRDPTSIPTSTRSRISSKVHELSKSRTTLRIGIPLEYNIQELHPTVRSAWHRTLTHLQQQGHTIHPVSLPATQHALSAYYVLAPAEASSNLAKYDGIRYGTRAPDVPDNAGGYLYAHTRGTGFGAEVQRRIVLGAFTLSAAAMDNYFIQAQKVRRQVQSDFNSVFRLENPILPPPANSGRTTKSRASGDAGVDVLVCPTAPSPPPSIKSLQSADPVETYMNDVFTVPASLAGLPALSVPVKNNEAGGDEGCAVGMQVIGQFGDDEMVLGVGDILERINASAK